MKGVKIPTELVAIIGGKHDITGTQTPQVAKRADGFMRDHSDVKEPKK